MNDGRTLPTAPAAGRLLTDPKMETGKLIAVLDVLAEHFSAEIKRDLERGANV